ncbi:MAG: ferredoxin reductase [Limnobacter sp.]|nr:ferredoxin reductase [Limnobacter sp.]
MRTEKQLTHKVVRGLSKILGQESVDFWLQQAGSIQSATRCLARVARIEKETPLSASIWLEPNGLFEGFKAGQHVNVGVTVNGVVHTRSYSFSNAPSANGLLRLTVKKTPDGVVSNHLVENLQVGDVIELGDVFGDMTLENTQPELDQQEPELLLLAAGSGITPMMSLLEALEQKQWPANVTLIVWARNPEDVIFNATLSKMAEKSEQFNYVRALEEGANVDQGDLEGRPSKQQIEQHLKQIERTDVYACGPDGFMKVVESIVGQDAKSLHTESFTPVAMTLADDVEVKTFPITLSRSNRVVEVPNNKPLLKALLDKGINAPHGCGMGICNTCSCEKLLGTTQNMQNQSVCGQSNTALRLCVNAAQSPLTLDL